MSHVSAETTFVSNSNAMIRKTCYKWHDFAMPEPWCGQRQIWSGPWLEKYRLGDNFMLSRWNGVFQHWGAIPRCMYHRTAKNGKNWHRIPNNGQDTRIQLFSEGKAGDCAMPRLPERTMGFRQFVSTCAMSEAASPARRAFMPHMRKELYQSWRVVSACLPEAQLSKPLW